MNLKLSQLIDQFVSWSEKARAAATVNAYHHQLRKFLANVGDKPVSKLRPSQLEAWATTWHEWQAVMRLFNWAVRESKLLRTNPFAGMQPPLREQRQRIMTPAEMQSVLRAAGEPGRSYLLAVRETYARPQEIRLACWEDLQSADPEISVERALAEGKAVIVLRYYKDRRKRRESTKPRVLIVSQRLGRSILRIRRRRKSLKGAIWRNSKGTAWSNNAVRCLMRRIRAKLDIEADRYGEVIVAYTFRHSMATLASSKGIKDRMLADLLGHVETRTTARYQHLDVEHIREALERIKRRGKAA